MEYWKNLISMAQRALSDKGENESVSVIHKGKLDIRFNSHDDFYGIDYYDIVFQLRYKDYVLLSNRSELEEKLDKTITSFHNNKFICIANVIIEPIIER